MDLSERPAGRAKLIGGRLCLDFINTVGGRTVEATAKRKAVVGAVIREDRLLEYADLVAWSLRAGIVTSAEAARLLRESKRHEAEAKAALTRAVVLREALWRICKAIIEGLAPRQYDLDSLNRELALAYGRVQLTAGEKRVVWKWQDATASLDRMLWPVADSAAEYLTSGDLTRLRECGGENCGWLFEDTSRNRSRQWCDMQDCGNLAKVRRFRSRVGE